MILVEDDRIIVRDDASQGGTFVNDTRIETTACLFHGDRLRVGKLEFEAVISPSSTSALPSSTSPSAANNEPGVTEAGVTEPAVAAADSEAAHRETIPSTDTIAELVVDMLIAEDEQERNRRRYDPAARSFHLHVEPASEPEAAAPTSEKVNPFEKRPPAKLPPPPPVRGNDSVDAAEQALAQLLGPQTKKKPS
jgi:predicted component of type VI protein secretion system